MQSKKMEGKRKNTQIIIHFVLSHNAWEFVGSRKNQQTYKLYNRVALLLKSMCRTCLFQKYLTFPMEKVCNKVKVAKSIKIIAMQSLGVDVCNFASFINTKTVR